MWDFIFWLIIYLSITFTSIAIFAYTIKKCSRDGIAGTDEYGMIIFASFTVGIIIIPICLGFLIIRGIDK